MTEHKAPYTELNAQIDAIRKNPLLILEADQQVRNTAVNVKIYKDWVNDPDTVKIIEDHIDTELADENSNQWRSDNDMCSSELGHNILYVDSAYLLDSGIAFVHFKNVIEINFFQEPSEKVQDSHFVVPEEYHERAKEAGLIQGDNPNEWSAPPYIDRSDWLAGSHKMGIYYTVPNDMQDRAHELGLIQEQKGSDKWCLPPYAHRSAEKKLINLFDRTFSPEGEKAEKVLSSLNKEERQTKNHIANGLDDTLKALKYLRYKSCNLETFKAGAQFFDRQVMLLKGLDKSRMNIYEKNDIIQRQWRLRSAQKLYNALGKSSPEVQKQQEQYFAVPVAETDKAKSLGLEVVQVGVWKLPAETEMNGQSSDHPAQHFQPIPAPIKSQQQTQVTGMEM